MALTDSTMMPLGTKAPDFNLTDVTSGEKVSLSDLNDNKALLVIFICQHCPYVKHVEDEIARIGKDYQDKGLGLVAISSNDTSSHPADSPQHLKQQAKKLGFNFPYLFDQDQSVAKKYTAACTPDFFLFDGDRELIYRGQLDDSRPGNNIPVTGESLREAIDAFLNDQPVSKEQKPSSGCNIKWKPGNQPDYS